MIIPEKDTAILINRTDSIGDVILTIPIASFLKNKFPDNKVLFFASAYTTPILKIIDTIDDIIIYDKINSNVENITKQYNIETVIHAFPTYETSKLFSQLKIKNRVGTSHRWYNWLYCNYKINFSRKNSEFHESQLNFNLLKPFGIAGLPSLLQIQNLYQIKSIPPPSQHILSLLDNTKKKIILHPKSKGSAREWGIDNFIRLIKLVDKNKYQIIISGTKAEREYLDKVFQQCPEVTDMCGKVNLDEFIALINHCDVLVAASTGPLHIAAILNKCAVGLYPSIKPMHAGRWQPIGKNAHALFLEKNCNDCRKTKECACILSILPEQVYEVIEKNTVDG